ncbi:hypothetical protein [Nonomuraea sp. NPDC003804]|uniref:hypothetical protein n=1 Tax=Nonomuraea sp. NPDC003804 TaxID=3154547 RepID=UPI0033B8E1B2
MPGSLSQAVIATAEALRRRGMTERISDIIGGAMPLQPPDEEKAARRETISQAHDPDDSLDPRADSATS